MLQTKETLKSFSNLIILHILQATKYYLNNLLNPFFTFKIFAPETILQTKQLMKLLKLENCFVSLKTKIQKNRTWNCVTNN